MRVIKLIFSAVIIGIIVLVALGFFADFNKAIFLLSKADYFYILAACFFAVLAVACVFFRWAYVVESMRIKVRLWKLFLISCAGIAFSNLVPSGRVGGEPVRAYLLKKQTRKPTSVCLSTIVSERIFDAVTFCVLSLFVIIYALFLWKLDFFIIALMFLAFAVCCAIAALLVYVSVNHRAGTALLSSLLRFFPHLKKKFARDILVYTKNVKALMIQKKLWFYGFVYSLFVWFFDVFRTYFVFLALGYNVSFMVIAGAIIISALLGAIPISPGGLGLVEAGMMVVFLSMGISATTAGIVTIIDRLISYWIPTFFGVFVAYYLGMK
jgi:uncharacterized protein (TIRG00374 family)